MKYSITFNTAVKSFHTSLARSMAYITMKEWLGVKELTLKEWLGLKDNDKFYINLGSERFFKKI